MEMSTLKVSSDVTMSVNLEKDPDSNMCEVIIGPVGVKKTGQPSG